MNRRVAILVFSLAFVYFIGVLGYVHYTHPNGTSVQLRWTSPFPPCTSAVKVNCALSVNILAFRQDGSMLMVGNSLPPTTAGVDVALPEGLYDVWVVVSGRSESGNFTLSLPLVKSFDVGRDGSKSSSDPEPDSEEDLELDKA